MRDQLKEYVQQQLFLAYDAGDIEEWQYRGADQAIEKV